MSRKFHLELVFLIFLNGYVSLSLELLVLRQLSFWVGSSPVVTSIIMGTFLGFMSLGYFIGTLPAISGRRIMPILGASFLFISFFGCVAAGFPLVAKYFEWMYAAGITSGVIQTFVYSIIFLSVGPFLFGINTTLLSRMLHEYNTNYAGHIMAFDTIGSVLGSVATTLVLMPFAGVNNTVIFVCALGAIGALIAWRRWWVWLGVMCVMVPCVIINSSWLQRRQYGILVNNANSTISVKDFDDTRILYMNSLPMSVYFTSTGRSAMYIDFINDNFINTLPRDRRRNILVLGAGGFTAGMDDDFHEYTFVDIEPTLQDVAEQYFLERKLTPNKHFIVQDASQFLKNTTRQYDLILLDVYSNSYQIPEGLITAEFMARVKSRVAPGGIVLMNIVSMADFSDKYTRVFDNTFHAVFTHNTSRHIVGPFNPWTHDGASNIIYVFHNLENDGRIYTINNTPVIYDR